jgi:hypothetical protein
VTDFRTLPKLGLLALVIIASMALGLPAGAAHPNVAPGSRISHPGVGPQMVRATVCPRPDLAVFEARPTSVSGPYFLNPTQARLASPSTFVGTCRWKLTFDIRKHDPTVYITTGQSVYLVPGVIDGFDDVGTYGVHCAAYYQIDNGFGGAAAQAELEQSSCNTDGFLRGEGTATIDNANLQAGPTVTVAPLEAHWYVSYIFGANALVGQFTFCSQDPLGQHSAYACLQFSAGPFEYN